MRSNASTLDSTDNRGFDHLRPDAKIKLARLLSQLGPRAVRASGPIGRDEIAILLIVCRDSIEMTS
jgi:hypothetical protein